MAHVLARLSAFVGLGVSVWLTWIKHRIDHLCDGGGCGPDSDAWLGCDEALGSAWSQLLGLPLSIWSTALFVVALAAARATRGSGPLAPAALLILAITGLLAGTTSAALAAYAFTHFSHICPYCTAIHLSSLVLCFAGLHAFLPVAGTLRRTRAASRAVLAASMSACTLFVVLVGGQAVLYRAAAWMWRCAPLPSGPPEPTIRLSVAGETRQVLLLFADPSCSRCAEEIHDLHQSLVHDGARWAGTELWLYPLPFARCGGPAVIDEDFLDHQGKPLNTQQAQQHDACLAARAVECVGELDPGSGFRALVELYGLLGTDPPFFSRTKILKALEYSRATAVSPEALTSCLEQPRIDDNIAQYQRYLFRWCRTNGRGCSVPQAFVVPVDARGLRPDEAAPADDADKILILLGAEL